MTLLEVPFTDSSDYNIDMGGIFLYFQGVFFFWILGEIPPGWWFQSIWKVLVKKGIFPK